MLRLFAGRWGEQIFYLCSFTSWVLVEQGYNEVAIFLKSSNKWYRTGLILFWLSELLVNSNIFGYIMVFIYLIVLSWTCVCYLQIRNLVPLFQIYFRYLGILWFQVDWGEASMIQAERILLQNALMHPLNERFIFLSDRSIYVVVFICLFQLLF